MLANCKSCDGLFNRTVHDICPNCIRLEEELFDTVRSYLKENTQATMVDVVETIDVTTEQLIGWIEAGRLFLHENPNFSLECERCQSPTQAGRYCSRCKDEMYKVFADATEQVKKLKPQMSNHGYFSR